MQRERETVPVDGATTKLVGKGTRSHCEGVSPCPTRPRTPPITASWKCYFISVIKKLTDLFYIIKCVQSLGIKKVLADTPDSVTPETPPGRVSSFMEPWWSVVKTLGRVRS